MKIAFHGIGVGDTWLAGGVYTTGLLHALRDTYGTEVSLCLLASKNGQSPQEELRRLADEMVVLPTYRRWTPVWAINCVPNRLLRRDLVGDLMLRRRGVRAIAFGGGPRGSRIPTLLWLPDFQHIHLPEMFSVRERECRNSSYLRTAERATRVILLSESVRRDFESFAPQYAGKARAVSPVSHVPESVYDGEPTAIADVYHLPHRFVYLPNQFWKHKNHLAVWRALRILKGKGIQVYLVCSGYPGDHRHPSYFAEMLQELCRLDIRDQVALLGLVPRDHVFQLMRQSIAVLNPSLFEGYGMTVDEARSVGKKALLSDIPPHREQNPPGAIFFNPMDSAELADRLEQIWQEKVPGPDLEREAEARRTLPERIRRYAEGFMAVVQEVISEV